MIIEIDPQLNSIMANIIIFSRKNASLHLQSIITPKKYLKLTDEKFLHLFMPEKERELLGIMSKFSEYNSCHDAIECEDSLDRFLLQNKKSLREEIYVESRSLLDHISKLKSNQVNYDNCSSTEEDEDFSQKDFTSNKKKLKDSLELQDRIIQIVFMNKIVSSGTTAELQNVLESISLLFSYHSTATQPRLYSAAIQLSIFSQLRTDIENGTLIINGDLDAQSSKLTTAYGLRQKFKDLLIYDKLITKEQAYKISQVSYIRYTSYSTESTERMDTVISENQDRQFQPS